MFNPKEYQREYQHAHYIERKAAGVCVKCGKADEHTREGRTLCSVCQRRQYLRAMPKISSLYMDRRAVNRCVRCGAQDERTQAGRCECLACVERRKMQRETKRALRAT